MCVFGGGGGGGGGNRAEIPEIKQYLYLLPFYVIQ